MQGIYSAGMFESLEGRLLAKLNPRSRYRLYCGLGYVRVTTDKDIIGVRTRFEDDGMSAALGLEMTLGRRILLSAEASAARIDLTKEVTNGSQRVIATVKYAPVTLGITIAFPLF
jgi:hypothetical protein